jgi:hypothetical protein
VLAYRKRSNESRSKKRKAKGKSKGGSKGKHTRLATEDPDELEAWGHDNQGGGTKRTLCAV